MKQTKYYEAQYKAKTDKNWYILESDLDKETVLNYYDKLRKMGHKARVVEVTVIHTVIT